MKNNEHQKKSMNDLRKSMNDLWPNSCQYLQESMKSVMLGSKAVKENEAVGEI